MSKLTSKERNALPDSAFAIPSQRKYPINDASHRQNAKARASGEEHKGHISKSTEEKIFRKANAKMHKDGYDRHLGNPAHAGHHSGHVDGHGEVDGHDGHKGHDGVGGMKHMGVPNLGAQSKKHIGKHGGKIGQHAYGGTNSGNHSFHNIMHRDHHSKMTEG